MIIIGANTNNLIKVLFYNFIGMKANKQTTIMVSREVWKKLNSLKECGDSMNDVVAKILKPLETIKPE